MLMWGSGSRVVGVEVVDCAGKVRLVGLLSLLDLREEMPGL